MLTRLTRFYASALAATFVVAALAGTVIAERLGDTKTPMRGGYASAATYDPPKEVIAVLHSMAEQGDVDAQIMLGIGYLSAKGDVPQDYAEGAKWFRMAAEQGAAGAQFILGDLYANGDGVAQDYVQAHKWYGLAVSRFPALEKVERDFAVKSRDRVATKMTPAQIAEAQKLARKWKPTK